MLRRLRVPSRFTPSGTAWILVSRTNWARSAVTSGLASLVCQNSLSLKSSQRPDPSMERRRLRSILAMQPRVEIVGPGGRLGLEQPDLVHGLRDHQGPVGADGERNLAASADDASHVLDRKCRGLPLGVGAGRCLSIF